MKPETDPRKFVRLKQNNSKISGDSSPKHNRNRREMKTNENTKLSHLRLRLSSIACEIIKSDLQTAVIDLLRRLSQLFAN